MKVILLTNKEFVGDKNQLKGIQSAIQAKIKEEVEFVEIEESEFKTDSLDKSAIVLASGSHGLAMTQAIKLASPETQIIWSGHQYFSELDSIEYMPDIVALPETSLSSEEKKANLSEKTKLVLTTGVAHSVNHKTVAEDHARFQGELPMLAEFPKQIGIILAGDAPTPDCDMKYFSEENAAHQASLIAGKIIAMGYDAKDTAIMVTNGPRTGKHDPSTGKVHDPEPHRSGQVDASSRAFLNALSQELKQSKIDFFDFQFADLEFGPSAYKPMIKQVADSAAGLGLWFVPAESTSMVTESSYFLESRTPVIIYHPSSENPTHSAHAEDAVRQGFAMDIDSDVALIKPPVAEAEMESAATKIAETFYQEIVLTLFPNPSSISSSMYAASSSNTSSSPEAQSQLILPS